MFQCKDCLNKYTKWSGKCKCGQWNSIIELEEEEKKSNKVNPTFTFSETDHILQTISCAIEEFSRVCTLNKRSVILIGGEPGIGKSTLMCQIASAIDGKCLYLTGEESVSSVKNRFERICESFNNVEIFPFFFLDSLEDLLKSKKPDLVILDSIHTTRTKSTDSYGTQSREIVFHLSDLSKKYNTVIICVSHITKDGIIAGPKMLEHMVDVVLYLEGDRYGQVRLLRSIKNRFGPTNETGVFEMHSGGLVEVKNPSSFFISNKRDSASGSVIFSGIAGMRPFLIEVQSLVCDSNFPQIETVGFDLKRTKMILAILQQWCGFFFGNKDVYVNIVGGMKITDSAVDLAVAMAIASSFKQRTISAEVCFFGELGLTGEIRRATSAELRVKESLRLGFKKVFANSDLKGVTEVNLISKLMDLL